ncbi:MAG TPA: type II and III secretion system protein family protein [Xanthobacteraceae bacterium]|nr:type II and III secretion system protein family protein [Xanthobacteraceae bacterium]
MNKKQHAAATKIRRRLPAASRFGLILSLLMAGMLVLTGAPAVAQTLVHVGGANRTATVNVATGKSVDVRTDASFSDVTVGDPEIADVNVITDHSLSILGKKSGTTRVTVYGDGKKLVGIFDVEVSYDTSMLSAEITRRFPHAGIHVTSANGKVMLTGHAPDAATLDQAVTIAKQFGPDVINSVSVDSPQQVMLEVRFLEATRQASRELGVQWNVFSGSSTTNIGARQPAGSLPLNPPPDPHLLSVGEVAAGVLSGGQPFGVAVARMIAGGVTTDVLINALEQRGLARSLAEPNLVALSGDTASFLAGGEYPIPIVSSLGNVTVDYKRYGVGLAFTPTVLKDGLINLKIEPEVSQLDTSHVVSFGNGGSVFPLIVRRASTTVELRDGQSFVIGGLLQNNGTTAQDQLPWVGDVPILGALFRSASYQKNETDLSIIVTPHLVRPSRPGDVVASPLDSTLPANDADLFLMGKPEIPRHAAKVAADATVPLSGHILDLPNKGGIIVSAKD